MMRWLPRISEVDVNGSHGIAHGRERNRCLHMQGREVELRIATEINVPSQVAKHALVMSASALVPLLSNTPADTLTNNVLPMHASLSLSCYIPYPPAAYPVSRTMGESKKGVAEGVVRTSTSVIVCMSDTFCACTRCTCNGVIAVMGVKGTADFAVIGVK